MNPSGSTPSPSRQPPARSPRIGLILLRQIGDVLLITPALAALRQAHPNAHICALVNDFTAPMLGNNPDLDALLPCSRPKAHTSWIQRLRSELALVKAWRQQHLDLTIDFTNGDRPALLAFLSGARQRIAYLPSPSKWDWRRHLHTHIVPRPATRLHQVQRYLNLLSPLGIPDPNPTHPPYHPPLKLELTPDEHAFAQTVIPNNSARPTVVAHFVANWLFKCWEDAKAARIIDWLQESAGLDVLVTCGPAPREQERTRSILALCQTQPRSFIGTLSLRQLAALIAHARLFIGVDTAPMHMAAALGTPLVALFGPTDRTQWHPWSPDATLLAPPCPCLETRKKLCPHNSLRDCLKALTIEEVQKAILQRLSTIKPTPGGPDFLGAPASPTP